MRTNCSSKRLAWQRCTTFSLSQVTVNREHLRAAIAIPDDQMKMSMGPAVVVAAAVAVTVEVTVAADMVAVVLDAELYGRSSCGLFHVRGEAQNCHSNDCESYRDEDIVVLVVVVAAVDHTTHWDGRHVGVDVYYWLDWFGANADNNNNDCVFCVAVRADYDNDGVGGGGGVGCRNDRILVQTIY